MLPEDKIKAFQEELDLIPLVQYQNWLKDCLYLVPDYTFEISSSNSNTHHPYWDLGPGGTVRHTKAVTRVAYWLTDTMLVPVDTNKEKHDHDVSKLICAAVLHDSFKYGISFDIRSFELHPYIPRVALGKVSGYGLTFADKDLIFKAVESHMGSYFNGAWSPLHYVTQENLRKEPLCHILHEADFIASREDFIDKRFTQVNQGMDLTTIKPYEQYSDEVLKGIIIGAMMEVMPEEQVLNILVNERDRFQGLFTRVAAIRFPYNKRKTEYYFENIINTAKENIPKLFTIE